MDRNKMKKLIRKLSGGGQTEEIIYNAYTKIFRRDELEREEHFGNKNANETIYIIRPKKDSVEGLLSLFLSALIRLEKAIELGYKPVVDWKNYKTQYHSGKTENVWEWYFMQPSGITLYDAYDSKNVILSGITMKGDSSGLFPDTDAEALEEKNIEKMHQFIVKNIRFTNRVLDRLEKEWMMMQGSKVLGLFIRGTDYIALKPEGESIQPELNDIFSKVDEFLLKYEIERIFLVTEDKNIYLEVKNRYHELVHIVNCESFVENYDGKDYLYKSFIESDTGYERGMTYLIKILLLSRCQYFIGGITSGSKIALAFNGNQYKEKYVFSLGKYRNA